MRGEKRKRKKGGCPLPGLGRRLPGGEESGGARHDSEKASKAPGTTLSVKLHRRTIRVD